MTTEIQKLPSVEDNLAALLRIAVERGASADDLEKFVSLHERIQAPCAVRDFNRAFAAFRAECPPIPRTKVADFPSKQGGRVVYDYAPMDTVERVVLPILTKHGLSYRFARRVDGDKAYAVCVVMHASGHSIEADFPAPDDERATAMTSIQKTASGTTFAKRQALISALGLATCDPDDDGAGGSGVSREPIGENDRKSLNDMMFEAGYETPAASARFLKWLGVASLKDVTVDQLDRAYAALEKRIAERAKQ